MSNDTMRETVRRARELLAFVSPEPDNWSEHNALIAAGLCNDELPALCDEIERLRADLSRVTEERNALRAAIVEYDVAKLCLARFHPHHRTHTEAGRSAVRRMVDAEAALRALAEVPRG